MPEPSMPAGDVRTLRVPDGAAAERVDRFVADVTGLSRSYVQKLISDGRLTSDGQRLRANTIVNAGQALELDVPPPESVETEADSSIPVVVVYEDPDLLIVD